ncbi:MAG: flagellar export chaperone FlgN [Candidatus Kapabacteria bacterium]|nr:flagellar export chaperone FlgN [Candidatus Kapabacteria bacterium]
MTNTALQTELISILSQEREFLEQIVELAEHQQQALIRFDADKIESIALEQERLSKSMTDLEMQRFRVISIALGITLREAQSVTLSQMIDHLAPEHVDEMMNVKMKMSVLVTKLQFLNSVNRVLALRGRNSVRSTLDFISQEKVHVVNASL